MTDHKRHAQTVRIDLGSRIDRKPEGSAVNGPEPRRSVRVVSEAGPYTGRERRAGGDAFNELLQNMYDGVIVTTLAGKIINVNKRAQDFLKCSGEEVFGLNISDILAGADHKLIATLLGNLENSQFTLIQGYMLCKDGQSFPAEISANRMRVTGEDGLIFFVRDITLRKQREDQLRTGYSALENSGSGIAMTDLDGYLDYANPALRRLWNVLDDQPVTELNVLDFVADDRCLDPIIEALQDGEAWSGELKMLPRGRDPIEVRASVLANVNEDEEITGLVFSLVDVTEERSIHRALEESEQRYRILFREMLSGFALHELLFDAAGRPADYRFITVNPAFERMTGLKAAEVEGKTVLEVLPGTESYWIETYGHVVRTGEPAHFTNYYEVLGKHFEVTAYRSGPNQFATMFDDITDRIVAEKEKERLQAQLRQVQKIEAVGRLAGGVAHDFNNLLMGIMGYVQLGMDDLPPDHPVRGYLDEIMVDAKRSSALTRQLLAFARRQPIAPKNIELNEMVSGMLSMLRRLLGEDIVLVWEAYPEPCVVNMDPSQLDQVLANLIINSRDAINGVGKVTVRVEKVVVKPEDCEGKVEAMPGEYVVLEVSDSGCGIDEASITHIFEPFFTTKDMSKGTGLGLATVHGIVRQNNGFIALESQLGKGTTFRLYLPLHDGGEDERADAEVRKGLPCGTETILLVEDEDSVRTVASAFLLKQGYNVMDAVLPDIAIKLAAELPGEIDLLVTDVIMPGMNGVDLAKHLLRERPEMACLFMSGYTDNVVLSHGLADKHVHFIQKPFTKADLLIKVREVLDADANESGATLPVNVTLD